MLRFEQLSIKNFGPFKGKQSIDFGKQDGVIIIWGENGRGKTTLLNVFRFALFDHVKNRHGSSTDYMSMYNIEAAEEGEYGFSVCLTMQNDEDRYVLTRDVHLREGVKVPKTNEDFIEDCFLKKNGNILAVSDRKHELEMIMPADISRFFLFDGELLQEYETLLDDTSNDGQLIKESIEKILGMPILSNGLSDIRALVSDYITVKNKTAQNDKNTAEYAQRIAVLIDQIAGHEQEKKRLEELFEAENDCMKNIKQRMGESEKLRGLLTDEEAEKRNCENLRNRRNQLQTEIQGKMKTSWQGVVEPTVLMLISEIREKINTYSQKKVTVSASQSVIREIEYAIRFNECKICSQHVSSTLAEVLSKKLAAIKAEAPLLTEDEQQKLKELQTRLNALQSIQLQDDRVLLRSKIEDLKREGIELSTSEQRLHDLHKQISTYGEFDRDALTINLAKEYSTCSSKIMELKDGISREQKAIDDAVDKRNKLDAKVNQLSSNTDVLKASRRLALCQQIESIFNIGIDQYRTRLKDNVESDASELFIRMSADKDYERLQINDNYGLEIIHKKGIKVPSRSAGFEHVVALALIGALHKNAPLRGPVIMDSPFGRLSSLHEKNVSQNLPLLSDQVIVLVHDRELTPAQTRQLLGGKLIKEYKLERVTSFHTKIS